MLVRFDFALRKVISGGQTGADQAGLVVAQNFNLETGGFAPDGFKTILGPRPVMLSSYGLVEGGTYPARTEKNVRLADATIRFASNFQSPGELCTLRAINKHAKPYLDIQLPATDIYAAAAKVVDFIEAHTVQVLNIAGNADPKHWVGPHYVGTFWVLHAAFKSLHEKGHLAEKEQQCPTQ